MRTKAIIWRHKKERLSKCSLRGLEGREDLVFCRTPPCLTGQVVLGVDGPPLKSADQLVLLDGTWRYVDKMRRALEGEYLVRSLPRALVTAYPRRQDEPAGLASVEALYAAYRILGWPVDGLLDHYIWKERFLDLNKELL